MTLAAVTTTWSQQHQDLFAWFTRGDERMIAKLRAEGIEPRPEILAIAKRALVDRARAGTGKTTGIVKGVAFAPEDRIGMFAFNKRIQEELDARVKHLPNVEVVTLHSAGLRAVTRFWERIKIEKGNAREAALANAVCGDDDSRTPLVIKRLVGKLLTKAREIAPHAKALGDLTEIAIEFDCAPDEGWERDGFGLEFVEARTLEAMDLAAKRRPEAIDYADMIFLPLRNRWLRPIYGLGIVDEAQDMTVSQLEIARGLCLGRLCLVGDDRQGIYAFRGADTTSIDRLKAELGAAELGLTVTYRCPKAVVAEAKKLVPDYEAAPNAPEGLMLQVPALPTGGFGGALDLDLIVEAAQPTDFILSRTNAPLAQIAMACIRKGKRVRIQGRDIGAGLVALVKRLATGAAAHSVPKFLERLRAWEEREVARAIKAGLDGQAEKVRDRAATLREVMDGVRGMRELETRLDMLFRDRGEPSVVCSSVHKAKGLEAKRVFVLRGTLYPKLPCECGHYHDYGGARCLHCACSASRPSPKRELEEANIHYVAITRAMDTLVYVDGRAR